MSCLMPCWESFLNHARNVYDFLFLSKSKSKSDKSKSKSKSDDILLGDFVKVPPNFYEKNKDNLGDFKTNANKHLAHLTYKRRANPPNKKMKWDFEVIYKELSESFEEVKKEINRQRKQYESVNEYQHGVSPGTVICEHAAGDTTHSTTRRLVIEKVDGLRGLNRSMPGTTNSTCLGNIENLEDLNK